MSSARRRTNRGSAAAAAAPAPRRARGAQAVYEDEYVEETRAEAVTKLLVAAVVPFKQPGARWVVAFLPALVSAGILLGKLGEPKALPGPPAGAALSAPAGGEAYAAGARVDVLSEGYEHATAPLWVEEGDAKPYLLFSDAAQERVWRWEDSTGLIVVGCSMYLHHVGCGGDGGSGDGSRPALDAESEAARCGALKAPGAASLLRTPRRDGSGEQALLIAEHGDRRIVRLEANGTRTAVVGGLADGAVPLNAPSHMAQYSWGDLFFTDPGLGQAARADAAAAPAGDAPRAVWRVRREALGTRAPPELVDATLAAPTGLAFSPDYARLYVADADAEDPKWMAYPVQDHDGAVGEGTVLARPGKSGGGGGPALPLGGIAVDSLGRLHAAGPGGVHVLDGETGQELAVVSVAPHRATGVALGAGHLYITTETALLRVKTAAKPMSVLDLAGGSKAGYW